MMPVTPLIHKLKSREFKRDSAMSEGFALQRTDSNLYSDRQNFVSVRVQPVLCFSISRWRTPSEGFALQRTDSNTKFDRKNRVSVRVQPVLCARAYHGGAHPRRDSPYSERTVILSSTEKIASPFACSPCYASIISRWCTPSASAIAKKDRYATPNLFCGGIRLTANGQQI